MSDDDLVNDFDADAVDIGIPVDKVCTLIDHAKRLDAKVPAGDDDDASNPTDDEWVEALVNLEDDPILEEIRDYIDGLTDDEQAAVVALVWVGRGSHDADAWDEAIAEATAEHGDHTADYLIGVPLLATYLEDGLDAFGLSC